MQTNLLYGVGDIGPSERQILQGDCYAPKLGGNLEGLNLQQASPNNTSNKKAAN
jgi:hypothetical protein